MASHGRVFWVYSFFAYFCRPIEIWCNGSTTDFGSVCPGSNPGISTMKTLPLIIVCLALFAGCKRGADNNATPYQTNIFPSVKVPESIKGSRTLSAEYTAKHYWDEFLSRDRLLKLKPTRDTAEILGVSRAIFTESFKNYVALLENVNDSVAVSSMTNLVERAVAMAEKGMPNFFGTIMEESEKLLFNSASPMMNDELYLPVLQGIQKCKVIPQHVKASYGYQMSICNLNRVGTVASDFKFSTGYGIKNMYSINADYLLIFFFSPDCGNCRQTLEMMKKSDMIMNLVGAGKMKVLAMAPEAESQMWREKRSEFPTDWIYACDADGTFSNGDVYVLRAIPGIYILDSQKKIIVKDGSIQHVLRVLSDIGENF